MRRVLYALGSGALVLVLSVGSVTAAHAEDGTTATDVQNAIATMSGLPDASDEVTTQSDVDSAAIATVNGMTVDVPKDADNSVKVTANGQEITIDMPDASQAQTGTVTANGVVAYPTTGNHANAVQTDDNGGVRFIQVLNSPDAPEEFHYDLHLPADSSIARLADGSLAVHTPTQDYTIETPWAYDATGKKVWTQFFTDGESGIDLVVNHWGEDVTYPITADPRFYQRTWYGANIVHYNRTETYKLSPRASSVPAGGTSVWPSVSPDGGRTASTTVASASWRMSGPATTGLRGGGASAAEAAKPGGRAASR